MIMDDTDNTESLIEAVLESMRFTCDAAYDLGYALNKEHNDKLDILENLKCAHTKKNLYKKQKPLIKNFMRCTSISGDDFNEALNREKAAIIACLETLHCQKKKYMCFFSCSCRNQNQKCLIKNLKELLIEVKKWQKKLKDHSFTFQKRRLDDLKTFFVFSCSKMVSLSELKKDLYVQ
jgi:hypothetical protein